MTDETTLLRCRDCGATFADEDTVPMQIHRKGRVVNRQIDWQPIETAPRDGTVIDLWHKDGFRITDGWWDQSDGRWVCLLDDSAFTHWKPITEPGS